MTGPAEPAEAERPWQVGDIPDQTGRTAVVTGPTLGGLGHHTALELARRGARVVLAGRTPSKIEKTAAAISSEVKGARLEQLVVDLSELASVREAATEAARFGPIDLLVNNAGVMGTPRRRTTDDLDLQMATNHFGPFLLTGLLLPQLVASGGATVVTVSSIFHYFALDAPTDDPHDPGGRFYRTWLTYGRTKLANLLFTHELDLRCRTAGLPVTARAAHPGFAGTHLARNGQFALRKVGVATILDLVIRAVSQSAEAGAWPTLMAATADLPGGTYVGPGGLGELGGRPVVVAGSSPSLDGESGRKLWEVSERTTGISYP